MATVGLSFGSATSGTGFDVASTVSQILAIESGVETPWKTQLTTLAAKDTALSSLGTNLAALSTALGSLTSFDGVLAAKQGSSSNTSVLALSSASSAATAGSHQVVVNALATTSSVYSDRVAARGDTLSGSLSIQVGSGTAQTLTIDSSSNTLSTLAAKINAGSYGVVANVVTDTQGSRLSLVSASSGAAGQITLNASLNDDTSSTAVNFQTGQQGADAQLTVDGLDTTSASNTVTGAIPGVTFQLLQAAPSSTIQILIANDNTSIESAVQSVATAYNAVVSSIKTQEGKDSTGNAEPLFGDPTLALVQGALSNALHAGAASGSIKSIAQLGLTLGLDGTLTFSQSTLDSSLNTSFNDVATFLQGAGGFGLKFSNTLNGLSSTGTQGALALALKQNATEEASLNANIARVEARVAVDKTRLTAELTLANQVLQSIPRQLAEIDQIYSAVTGYNTK